MRYVETGTGNLGAKTGGAYIAFRKKGVAATEIRFPVLVTALEHEHWFTIPLDSGNEFEFQILGASSSMSFDVVACDILGFMEDF